MVTEHRTSIGDHYRNIARESDARKILGSITPEMFSDVFNRALANPKKLFDKALKLEKDAQHMTAESKYVHDSAPDVHRLMSLIIFLDTDLVIRAYPDTFRQLIEKPDESVEDMIRKGLGYHITTGGVYPRLRHGLIAAFIPFDVRSQIINNQSDGYKRDRDGKHSLERMPDLSGLSTVEERFDAIVSLLTYDYYDAFSDACDLMGIDPSELNSINKNDSFKHTEFLQKVKRLHSSKFFYAILTDEANGGKDSLFDVRVDLGDNPQTSEYGQCPGTGYVRHFLTGLGNVLADNRSTVLSFLKT